MTPDERKEAKIEALPGTLIEAVHELEKDEFIQAVLGKHVSDLTDFDWLRSRQYKQAPHTQAQASYRN